MCMGYKSDGISTFSVDIKNCTVVIKEVPSRICNQCGEASYSSEVFEELERIIHPIRESGTNLAVTVAYFPKESEQDKGEKVS